MLHKSLHPKNDEDLRNLAGDIAEDQLAIMLAKGLHPAMVDPVLAALNLGARAALRQVFDIPEVR